MIYFTQIMQAEGIRRAVEFWRKNRGRCNGALYWQYNDCWPTVSWSGIDYMGEYKALHYLARSFYAPLAILSEVKGKKVLIHIVNDRNSKWKGRLKWECFRLDGTRISQGGQEIFVHETGISELIELQFGKLLSGEKAESAVLFLELLDGQGKVASRNQLLTEEKRIHFEKSSIKVEVEQNGRTGKIVISADCFAHYVYLSMEGVSVNFSDNFFDLKKGEKKEISFVVPEQVKVKELRGRLKVRSYADYLVLDQPVKDFWMRFRMKYSKKGIVGRIMTQI